MGTPFDPNNPLSDGWTPKRAGIEPAVVFQDDSGTYARFGGGTFIPPGWGAQWAAKRNAAASAKAVLAVAGDSIGQGFYATSLRTNGWVGLCRASLQATYGNGGSGFTGATNSPSYITTATGASAVTAYAADLWATTGTWSNNTVAGAISGPGSQIAISSTANSTITVSGTGATIKIHYLTDPANGTFSWKVDGGSATNVSTATTAGAGTTTISGLAAGPHTVTLTVVSGTVAIYGFAFENATGVVVDNYCGAAYKSANIGTTTTTYGLPSDWSGGYQRPADLNIIAVGVNDASATVSGDVWLENVRRYLAGVRENGTATGAGDVLVVMNHVGKWENSSTVYADYCARALGLCQTYGAALLNLWTIGRNSWNYWNGLGYWGNSATLGTGVSGTDSVHPSDAGHAFIASKVLPLLTA